MSDWTERDGQRIKTVVKGPVTIEIHRPLLTPEEKKHREQQVLTALALFDKRRTQ